MRRGAGEVPLAPSLLLSGRAELRAQLGVCKEPLDSRTKIGAIDDQARHAVVDGVDEPPDPSRNHRSAVGHGLAGDHAVALTAGRHAHHGSSLVEAPDGRGRNRAHAFRHTDRAGADDHARNTLRRS